MNPGHLEYQSIRLESMLSSVKGKAVPVTGSGTPHGCETSRLPDFLENRLTNGDEVSLTRRSCFPRGRFLVLISITA
jgi:hypothetical protein